MKNNYLLTAILVIVVGAVAFFGGMQYQKTQVQRLSGFNRQNAGMMGTRFNRQNGNFRPVRGQIISSDDKSITVKLPDGSSKIVLLNDKTIITEATSSSKQSLISGKEVLVLGSANSDGSVTAQDIQINPQGRFGQSQ